MDDFIKMSISSVSKLVNITSAKKFAFLLAVVLITLKSFQYHDSEPCARLLNGGTLMDEVHWQPDGCMLHIYDKRESQECLKNIKIAFVGDSRLRDILYFFINYSATYSFSRPEKAHAPVFFVNEGLNMKFYWIPEVNQSATELYESWIKNVERPDVIIQAAASHTIKRLNGSMQAINSYRANLTALMPLMKKVAAKNTKIYWMLQEPVYEQKLHIARRAITNEQLESYNQIAMSLFELPNGRPANPGIFVLKSAADVGKQMVHLMYDGLHQGEEAKQHIMQILLNLFCNVNQTQFGLCCQPPPPPAPSQIIAFALGCLCIIGSLVVHLFVVEDNQENVESGEAVKKNSVISNYKEVIYASAKMALILYYFYICDRTDIFMKSNKHYGHMRFFIPLLYVLFLGMFGIDQCKTPMFLNRDQTDEWKGWMQLVILIYHITGASKNVPIYMNIRLLVAMYLFMTGYGHFSYFWNKGDFSPYRVLNVLFRLNFLTVMLCIVMNRSYQFYYFVPLCTFWFVVLYFSMMMWPRAGEVKSKNAAYDAANPATSSRSPVILMSCKLLLLVLFIVLLFLSQRAFESIFSWWPAVTLFELPPGSVREWWFRCQLDRFAMLHGALFCFGYLICKRLNILEDSKQGCLFSTRGSLLAVSSAIVVLLVYMLWVVQCTDKVACNQVHTYASFLPITSFILIRNIPGYLRSNYSSFFAWFGKISLELFIGQYHIWLAADTKGVLVLGSPSYPTANLVLATFLFVCAAHEINHLTGIFAKYFLGSPKDGDRQVLLRFLIAIIVLLLINVPNFLFRHVAT